MGGRVIQRSIGSLRTEKPWGVSPMRVTWLGALHIPFGFAFQESVEVLNQRSRSQEHLHAALWNRDTCDELPP